MKEAVKRIARDETGRVLELVLIMLTVGGLILAPLLGLMSTGLLAGQVYEKKTDELYAADAGVEDAVWRIQSGTVNLTQCYSTYGPYTIPNVNNRNVTVAITLTSNTSGRLYNITSVAPTPSSNSSTRVESYLKFTPGGELNIFSGALASQTGITLGKDSTVNGDVYYCSGSNITAGGNWTYKGCGPFPSSTENQAFADAFKNEALKGGTWGTTNIGSSMNLGPKYIDGDLTASSGITINLTGIVYVKGNIRCENTLTITGRGSLVAGGSIYFKKLADYAVTGDSIIMSLNSDITIKKADPDHELSLNALLYAPNGAITFDKDMTVIGGVVAKSIVADKEGSFTYVPKTSWDFPGGLPGAYEIKSYSINP